MIKCSLTEFGGASAENVWLGVMKEDLAALGPKVMIPSQVFFPSGPTTQSTRAQYFGFVHHTSITNDVMEHEKWKVLLFF